MSGLRLIPYKVNNIDDVILCAKNVKTESVVPIFHVSNVTGVGIDFLKHFLNLLGKVKTNMKDDYLNLFPNSFSIKYFTI